MSDPQRQLTRANPVSADAPFQCEDCGHTSADNFCSQCGQARVPPPKTLLGILGDFVGQYFNLEGKLWRTLAMLIIKPGVLTQEYFAGRRTRYFTPVRLYLTLSLLFFTIASFTTGVSRVSDQSAPADAASVPTTNEGPQAQLKREALAALAKATDELAKAQEPQAREDAQDAVDSAEEALADIEESMKELNPAAGLPASTGQFEKDLWWLPGIDEAFEKLAAMAKSPEERVRMQKQLRAQLMGQSPRVLFVLLPLFAAFFKLAFRKRCFYSEAFTFTLHLHCVIFIAVLVSLWLPAGPFGFAAVVHGLFAMKRVFGEGWLRTSFKALFVFACYSSVLGLMATWLAYRAVLDL